MNLINLQKKYNFILAPFPFSFNHKNMNIWYIFILFKSKMFSLISHWVISDFDNKDLQCVRRTLGGFLNLIDWLIYLLARSEPRCIAEGPRDRVQKSKWIKFKANFLSRDCVYNFKWCEDANAILNNNALYTLHL